MNATPLAELRQVSGVRGSFACGPAGQVLAVDMPERYSSVDVEDAAARLANLFQTAAESVPFCKGLSLAYGEQQLVARCFGAGLVCVLADAALDREQLQLVAARVASQLAVG